MVILVHMYAPTSIMLILFFVNHITYTSSYWIPCDCNINTPVIPGADIIISGFDVTQLATNIDRSFKSPIFKYVGKYSCLKNIQNNICYIIPAELSIRDIDMTKTYQVEDLYDSYYDHVEIYSESYTCSMKIGVPDFSMSVNYHQELYESTELLSDGYADMGYAYYTEYMYELIMPPAYVLTLDDVFLESLNALPSNITNEQDDNMYNMFLGSYGGYYLNTVVIGGSFHQNQYVQQQYIMTYSVTETITEMQVGFNAQMFYMNYGYWSNSTEYTTTKQYDESSTTTITCYGGNISLECGSNGWKLSLNDYPAYTNVTYVPIYYLVNNDIDKYNTLKYKTEDYTRTGVLN